MRTMTKKYHQNQHLEKISYSIGSNFFFGGGGDFVQRDFVRGHFVKDWTTKYSKSPDIRNCFFRFVLFPLNNHLLFYLLFSEFIQYGFLVS